MKQEEIVSVDEAGLFLVEPENNDVFINEKPMGLFGGSAFMFGSMIGTGIFISVKASFTIFESNNILAVLFIWIFGGLVSLTGALCYAELGCAFPKTGGESVYYKETIGRPFSNLFIVMYVFVVKTISLAAIALTASNYIVNAFDIQDPGKSNLLQIFITLIFLKVTLLINFFHRNVITKFLYVFSLIKLLAIGLVISIGIYHISSGKTADWQGPYEFKGFDYVNLSHAFMGVCWSFEGWNSLGLRAGDIQNPSTNLLLSSIIGVFFVSIAYVATVISYSAVLGFQNVRVAKTVALDFARHTMKSFGFIMPCLVALSALGSTVGCLYTLGGVTTYAGLEGMLPGVFCLVHRRTRIAYFSIIFIFFISILFIFMDLDTLIQYCAFITWFFYFLSFVSLWVVKLRNSRFKPQYKSFSINYAFIVCIQLVCLYVVVMCFYNNLFECIGFAAVMLMIYLFQYLPLDCFSSPNNQKRSERMYQFFRNWFHLEKAIESDVQ